MRYNMCMLDEKNEQIKTHGVAAIISILAVFSALTYSGVVIYMKASKEMKKYKKKDKDKKSKK